ncbi:MAG: hypothetical protein LUI12_00450 [Clostridiales bacterium]|nr:hypothetical protein [Clostridiales bacterium]
MGNRIRNFGAQAVEFAFFFDWKRPEKDSPKEMSGRRAKRLGKKPDALGFGGGVWYDGNDRKRTGQRIKIKRRIGTV